MLLFLSFGFVLGLALKLILFHVKHFVNSFGLNFFF